MTTASILATPAAANAAPKASKQDKQEKPSAKTVEAEVPAADEDVQVGSDETSARTPKKAAPAKAKTPRGRKAREAGAAVKRPASKDGAVLGGSVAKPVKESPREASVKPPSDKNGGPCTRHRHRDGKGHDLHRGYGWGHYGKTDLPEDPEGPDDGDDEPPPPDDGGPTGDPTPDDVEPREPERFLPFTPLPVSRHADRPDDPFLPFTGGESRLLLAVAALVALMGAALRHAGGVRMHAYRRIAR